MLSTYFGTYFQNVFSSAELTRRDKSKTTILYLSVVVVGIQFGMYVGMSFGMSFGMYVVVHVGVTNVETEI